MVKYLQYIKNTVTSNIAVKQISEGKDCKEIEEGLYEKFQEILFDTSLNYLFKIR